MVQWLKVGFDQLRLQTKDLHGYVEGNGQSNGRGSSLTFLKNLEENMTNTYDEYNEYNEVCK